MEDFLYLEHIKSGEKHLAKYLPAYIKLNGVYGYLVCCGGKPYFIYDSGMGMAMECVDEDYRVVKENNNDNTGIRLRTLIDVAFSDHVKDYRTRQNIITKIFESLEEQELGDWLTEDTGRTYKLTFIPTDKN